MNNFTLLPNEIDEETLRQISAEELGRAEKLKRDFENQYQHQPTHRTTDLPPPAEIPQMAQQVLPTAPTIPPPTEQAQEEEQDTFCAVMKEKMKKFKKYLYGVIGMVFAAILTGILLRVFQSIPGMSQLVETALSLPALNALPIQHDYFETKRVVKSGPDGQENEN